MVDYKQYLLQKAKEAGVNPDILMRIVQRESGWNPDAQNPQSSAHGFFQLVDNTAKGLGVNSHDPYQNIDGGVKLFRQNLDHFHGDERMAALAQYLGAGGAEEYNRVGHDAYVKAHPDLHINDVPQWMETVMGPQQKKTISTDELLGRIGSSQPQQGTISTDQLLGRFGAPQTAQGTLSTEQLVGKTEPVPQRSSMDAVTNAIVPAAQAATTEAAKKEEPSTIEQIGTGLAKAGTDVLGMGTSALDLANNVGQFINDKVDNLFGVRTSPELKEKALALTGRDNPTNPRNMQAMLGLDPDHSSGYAEDITRGGATGVLTGPQKALQNAILGGLSGAGSEAAGRATEGTGLEPIARTVGAIAAPLAGGFVGATGKAMLFPQTTEQRLGEALRNANIPAAGPELDEANRLLQVGRNNNVNVLPSEALDNQGLRRLADAINANPGTNQLIPDYLKGRSNSLKTAFENQLDKGRALHLTEHDLQQGANDLAVNEWQRLNRERTAATRPRYELANQDMVNQDDIQNLMDALTGRINEVGPDSRLGSQLSGIRNRLVDEDLTAQGRAQNPAFPEVPETRLSRLSQVRKEVEDALNRNDLHPDSLDRSARGVVGPMSTDLNNILRNNSRAYRDAEDLYSGISEATIQPFEATDLYSLTKGEHGKDLQSILNKPKLSTFTNDIPVLSDIENSASGASIPFPVGGSIPANVQLNGEQLAKAIARNRLQQALDKADVQQPGFGTVVSNELIGDTEKANFTDKLLETLYRNNPEAAGLSQEAKDLAQIMYNTRRRPLEGSQTAGRQAMNADFGEGTIPVNMADLGNGNIMAKVLANILTRKDKDITKGLRDEHYQVLAKAMLGDDPFAALAELSKNKYTPATDIIKNAGRTAGILGLTNSDRRD